MGGETYSSGTQTPGRPPGSRGAKADLSGDTESGSGLTTFSHFSSGVQILRMFVQRRATSCGASYVGKKATVLGGPAPGQDHSGALPSGGQLANDVHTQVLKWCVFQKGFISTWFYFLPVKYVNSITMCILRLCYS